MARKTKTPTSTSPLEAVAGLIEERAKFEQWLDELEAKRGSTPPKVFDRVHKDYLSRLQGVMDQLKSHSEELQTHAATLNKKLVELASAEESRIEERAEAELRAKVGEMTHAEWDIVSKKADRELAKLKQDQELIEADLDRIQGILEELSGAVPQRTSGPASAPKVDEMEFLKSVVGTGPRPAVPQSPSPPIPTPSPTAQSGAPTTAPAARTSAETPAPRTSSPQPAQRTTGTGQPAAATPPAGAPAQSPPRAATPATPPAPASGASLKATTTTGSIDVPKTLKCQECGTMNYPSEWYCEKCGAELTVV